MPPPPIDHPPGHEIERLNREIEELYEEAQYDEEQYDEDRFPEFYDPLVGYVRRIGEFRDEPAVEQHASEWEVETWTEEDDEEFNDLLSQVEW